jgi:hypothetical protein
MTEHERDGYIVGGFWLQVLTVFLVMGLWFMR